MEVVYWVFKGIEAVFYLTVIIYIVDRWKRRK